ncbi:MAG: phosphonate C-P lyase system protein PhnH [Galbitalea sp.]
MRWRIPPVAFRSPDPRGCRPHSERVSARVALTILDEDCSAWFGGALGNEEAAAWLVFHTGVRLVADPADADFVFATPDSLPALDGLQLGTDEAPHRSATVVLDTRGCDGSARFRAEGPGIDGAATLDAAWAGRRFPGRLAANGTLFPRGVDLLLVGGNTVDALPRTTRLTAAKTVAKPDREG